MRRKRENETPQEQESRRESNRLRMAHLRASETVEEQGTRRKFNSLQMMQTRISETAQIENNTEQAEQRCKIVQQVKQDLVLKLQDMLQRNNSYIQSFKSAIENLGPDFRIIIHADKVPAGERSRRFNEPTTSEVAVIMAGDQHGKRDIVYWKQEIAQYKKFVTRTGPMMRYNIL
ncbi:helitron_like_N domain-containing protein [Trichonephila clavata]|uniref:Helitron_like_N domain-containing protein n=1 Tax=Trichonephila clavata TaxID=2740835 RepID=A0A8X6GBG1_TRICU|nr:helitron_like_N domain-containing protein [Trichonephila clavata]